MSHIEMLKQGEIEIGATDKNGNALKQFDFVVKQDDEEGISICCILYHGVTKEFVAMSTSDWWVPFQDLHVTEKLDHVIAIEFFGLERVGQYWGVKNQPFENMPVDQFGALNESTNILEKLGEEHNATINKVDGHWHIKIGDKDYSDERLGVAACLAAVSTVRISA
ncbi:MULTISPECIES: hypothetical protein [Bacillus cereus group]|uniref:hypothetical protein n=1 Tax=Bacillus cereus group TaxID=86661 RepID=UPI0029C2AA49|nr:hypothetical protein [Bacillus cereus group sp. BfR-BA-01700]MDX5839063.1 hypothetical protein [Bacillus cereus group sp. BfR-BA-01700]